MRDNIDYLAHERKNHNPGSFNAALKDLIVAIRHVRQGIPATEIQSHMPHVYALEAKLHRLDAEVGIDPHPYFQEIWEAIENEPQPDKCKAFAVCQVGVRGSEIVLIATGHSFPHHIIAEEWIKESGTPGNQYTILEVIEPESTPL